MADNIPWLLYTIGPGYEFLLFCTAELHFRKGETRWIRVHVEFGYRRFGSRTLCGKSTNTNTGEGLAWLRTDDESISQLRSPVAYKLKPVWKNRCDAGDVRFSIMLAARQKVCFKVGERPDASTKI